MSGNIERSNEDTNISYQKKRMTGTNHVSPQLDIYLPHDLVESIGSPPGDVVNGHPYLTALGEAAISESCFALAGFPNTQSRD